MRDHRIADRMRRLRRLADRAQHEPGARAVQEPLDSGEQQQRQVDQRIVAEQQLADHGQVGEAGNGQRLDAARSPRRRSRGRRTPRARCRTATGRGRSRPGSPAATASAARRSSTAPRRRPCRRRRPAMATWWSRRRERRHCADQHHALDAEVQHAGLFGDELAQRREHQRRPGGERQREQLRVACPSGAVASARRRTTRTR